MCAGSGAPLSDTHHYRCMTVFWVHHVWFFYYWKLYFQMNKYISILIKKMFYAWFYCILYLNHAEKEQQHQKERANEYNLLWNWEARERQRDLYPHPITSQTQALLRNVVLLKYCVEATSLKGHYGLLVQLVTQWNACRQDFHVGLDRWYQPTEEDIYFITGLSRRAKDFP